MKHSEFFFAIKAWRDVFDFENVQNELDESSRIYLCETAKCRREKFFIGFGKVWLYSGGDAQSGKGIFFVETQRTYVIIVQKMGKGQLISGIFFK